MMYYKSLWFVIGTAESSFRNSQDDKTKVIPCFNLHAKLLF